MGRDIKLNKPLGINQRSQKEKELIKQEKLTEKSRRITC